MRSGSLHSACASTKSMPCFVLFAADFAASNSNRIWYRNYTTTAAPNGAVLGCSRPLLLKQTVYEMENAQALCKPIGRVPRDTCQGFCGSGSVAKPPPNRHQVYPGPSQVVAVDALTLDQSDSYAWWALQDSNL